MRTHLVRLAVIISLLAWMGCGLTLVGSAETSDAGGTDAAVESSFIAVDSAAIGDSAAPNAFDDAAVDAADDADAADTAPPMGTTVGTTIRSSTSLTVS